jgi:hypothetical protein
MDKPLFPEYGEGGDFIGARRMRRAFRWCVWVVVVFTALLWFSEHFLRYDHAERLYIAALTKHPEAGRNFLRQAVVHDRKNSEFPSPKYVEALAEREEDDLILPTYFDAYELDSDNFALAIRYGCRLFHEGQVATARARFREATELAPRNQLPIYLEAAVIPWLDAENEDLEPSMALIARANGIGGTVAYPRPLWSPALPQDGYWYANLRREVVEDCSAPLSRFAGLIFSRAEIEITEGTLEPWVDRLEAMRQMGIQIAQGSLDSGSQHETELSVGGVQQVYLGLTIIGRALEQERRLGEKSGVPMDEELERLAARVREKIAETQTFEATRQEIVQDEREKYRFPVRISLKTLFVIACCYVAIYLICKVLRVSSISHNVGHSQAGRFALGLWGVCVFGLLSVFALVQRISLGEMPNQNAWAAIWWILVVCFTVFGLMYPRFVLVSATRLLEESQDRNVDADSMRNARRLYRAAYFSLSRRYLGIMFGVGLSAVCVWTVLYRILISVYPWEVELLAVGMRDAEGELVRQILTALGT